MLSKLEVRKIKKSEFESAMHLLDRELKVRVRGNTFLFEKFKEFGEFFIGIFLDEEIIGFICGFPREDYLLISEIAVDSRFQRRGFGKKLVKSFEDSALRKKYKKINAGAEDEAAEFYSSLGYKPFLLIQYKKGVYDKENFKNLRVLGVKGEGEYERLDIKSDSADISLLHKLRKKYPKASFQYIFTKRI